jgi:hypothetical protein
LIEATIFLKMVADDENRVGYRHDGTPLPALTGEPSEDAQAGKTEHLRFTAIWMKYSGRWQEVARRANIVPQLA